MVTNDGATILKAIALERLGMRVGVNEAGRDDEAGGIDRGRADQRSNADRRDLGAA